MICCKTTIGYGAPNLCGIARLPRRAARAPTRSRPPRENLGWNHEPFVIPQDIYAGWDAKDKGAEAERRVEREVRRLQEGLSRSWPPSSSAA
ncbi:MAG: hypothetical protein MZV65_12610 [Chromatiales bacterium]|nr:hypothetical protein [Chromatiales bacterium]